MKKIWNKIKVQLKDILVRSLKTFVEAFIAVLVVSMQNGIDITNKEALSSLVISACSAGICAVLNLILAIVKKEE